MDIRAIDHIEFYVEDAAEAANYLCETFGFTMHGRGGPATGMPDCDVILLQQGDITVLLTSALSDDHQAAWYVKKHGPGVAVIGLGVDDARSAYAETVARGAVPVVPPVTLGDEGAQVTFASVLGFGDIEHRFASRESSSGPFAPTLIKENEPRPQGAGLLVEVDHIAVCLPAGELADAVRWYEHVFGFSETFEERIIVGAQAMDSKVVQSASGRVTLTLLEPDTTRAPGQIDEFVREHGGAGVQHVAFRTSDIATAVRTISGNGGSFLTTPAGYYDVLPVRTGDVGIPVETLRELNILADRDNWGAMLQIFTESIHPRRTFFYEVIDRRGARTFGSNNIKALYEAVERQREVDLT